MKRKIWVVALVLMLCMLVGLATAEDEGTHTVTFKWTHPDPKNVDGDWVEEVYATVTVEDLTTVSAPKGFPSTAVFELVEEKREFSWWGNELTESTYHFVPFDFSTPIVSDLELYADGPCWKRVYFRVIDDFGNTIYVNTVKGKDYNYALVDGQVAEYTPVWDPAWNDPEQGHDKTWTRKFIRWIWYNHETGKEETYDFNHAVTPFDGSIWLTAEWSDFEQETRVTALKLNKTKASIKKGKTVQLKVKKPADAKVTWKSSDKKIATVDKNGKVKGKKKGTCVITCTASDGATAECKITVK